MRRSRLHRRVAMSPCQEGPPLPPALGHTPSWTGGDVLLWMRRAISTDPRTRSAGEIRPLNWPNDYRAIDLLPQRVVDDAQVRRG